MKKLITLLLLTSFAIATSQTVQLDSSFATTGFVSLPLQTDGYSFILTKLQPDGKILVSGARLNGAVVEDFLARYNQNGTIDTTFAVNGFYIFDDAIDDQNGPTFLILSNGSILCVIENTDAEITKLNPNGTVNTAFGTNGKMSFQFFNETSPYLDANDNLYVHFGFGNYLYKINTTSGTYDTTFGTAGSIALENTFFDEIYLFQDNKFLVGSGDTDYSTVPATYSNSIKRFSIDGSIDPTFGTNGTLKLNYTTNLSDFENLNFVVKVDPTTNGLYVIESDYLNLVTTIRKYDANGLAVGSFGAGGVATVPTNNYITDAQLFNNKLYLCGSNENNGIFNTSILRYTTTGAIDPTFNLTGVYLETTNSLEEWAESMSITTDGRIIVAGEYLNGDFNKIYLAKYKESNLSTTTFTDDFALHYQNPMADQLEVVSNKPIVGMTLYTVAGKQVGFSSSNVMNVTSLAKGVYIAKVVASNNASKIIKVIKN